MAENVTMDTLLIDIESSACDSGDGLNKLINSLKELKNATSSSSKSLKSISNSIRELNSSTKELSSTTNTIKSFIDSLSKTENLSRFVTSLSSLKSSSNTSFRNIGNLSNYIDKLKISSTGIETVSDNLIGVKNVTDSLSLLSTIPKATGLNSIIKQLTQLNTITEQLTDETIDNFINKIKKLSDGLQPLATNIDKISNGFSRLPSKLTQLGRDLDKQNRKGKQNVTLWDALTKGASGYILKTKIVYGTIRDFSSRFTEMTQFASTYEESLNLFLVTMGDYAEEATNWINKFSKALYLNPSGIMQYMGSFNSLIKGLGVGSDNAYFMSKNLTQLTYDLASFKNLDFETAYQKLQSAISGEIEPLRNVGVALSQNTLQELANTLGIQQNVATMNEAQKAQLRYIQIMKSSTEWQTDMGRTLISPANAVRVLQEQFKLLGQAIGRVFIPIIMKLLPYVMALTQKLIDLSNTIAEFLGYKITDIDYSGLETGSNYLDDVTNSAENATNSLKTTLAAFDDLNVVQTKSDSAGTGIGGIGGDLGLNLPGYDALSNLSKEFDNNLENAKKNLDKILELVKDIAVAFAGWKVASWLSGLTTIGGLSTSPFDTFKDKLSKLFGTGLLTLGVVLDYKGITEEDAMTSIAEKLGGTLSTAGGTFLITKDITLTLLVTSISTTIGAYDALQDLLNLNPTYDEVKEGYTKGLLGWLPEPVSNTLWDFGSGIGDFLYDPIDAVDDFITGTAENVENFFSDIGDSISDGVSDFFGGISEFFGAGGDINNLPSDIRKKIDPTFIGKHKGGGGKQFGTFEDTIKDRFKNIGKTLFDSFEDGMDFESNLSNVLTKAVNLVTTGELATNSTSKFRNLGDLLSNGLNGGFKPSDVLASGLTTAIEVVNDDKFLGGLTNNLFSIGKSIINDIMGGMNTAESLASDLQDGIINATNKDLLDKVNPSLLNLGTELSNSVANGFNSNNSIYDKIMSTFKSLNTTTSLSPIKSIFSSMGSTLSNALTTNIRFNTNILASNLQSALSKLSVQNLATGAQIALATGIKIKGYKDGGFPDSDIFMTNENGIPEMIGRIGNKTAVANNDQITTAITNAVVQGMNNSSSQGTPIIINIAGETAYKGVVKSTNRENDRYGTNIIEV